MPGFEGLDLIERYENCVVLDRKNWTCEFNDESGKFGFNSGNFVDNYSDSDIIYVTKAQWKRADASVDSLVNN
jgi:hypothetical protein